MVRFTAGSMVDAPLHAQHYIIDYPDTTCASDTGHTVYQSTVRFIALHT